MHMFCFCSVTAFPGLLILFSAFSLPFYTPPPHILQEFYEKSFLCIKRVRFLW